uniref:C2H2-type domain-containing protein n=1 Tax=Caenorhabditis japonica TaxID=281687 RepID=A0A8R1E2Y9_CAEJA
MANCLMQINQCGFANCGQHFANQYDLTAHIEYTHIPMIEEEVKRKAQLLAANSANGENPPQSITNNLPLSYYSRVFRSAYRPNPIKPEPLKVSFNHYKKRGQKDKPMHQHHMIHRVYRDMMASRGRHISLEEVEKRLSDVDFDECGPESNEVRFRCQMVDCTKRYKNMFALRMHMKISHAVVISEDAKSLTNFPSEDAKSQLPNAHSLPIQQGNTAPDSTTGNATMPPNATNIQQGQAMVSAAPSFGNPATNSTSYKCTYCTKRYKTSSGLSNHMMASHQKNCKVTSINDQIF